MAYHPVDVHASGPSFAWRSLFSAQVAGATACMTAPYDGLNLSSRTVPISFQFFATNPDAQIDIMYRRTSGTLERVIATLAMSTRGTFTNGTEIYRAYCRFVLPSYCWARSSRGPNAQIYVTALRPTHNGRAIRVFRNSGINGLQRSPPVLGPGAGRVGEFFQHQVRICASS